MIEPMPDAEIRRSPLARAGWVLVGLVCVAIGGVGIVLPGLPTTVFFIAAAACFAKSSPRLEAWVLGLPKIGQAVQDYRGGLGMPRRAKVIAITMMTAAVALSAWVIGWWWFRAALLVAWAIGLVVILRVPTKQVTPAPDAI
jgi:uncharacterized membrane protein YbaN (DUF454 family)